MKGVLIIQNDSNYDSHCTLITVIVINATSTTTSYIIPEIVSTHVTSFTLILVYIYTNTIYNK